MTGIASSRPRRARIALLALAIAAPAAASASPMVETVTAALERGYGATCALDNKPVPSGGYFPCLDIGPYRFVKGYGSVSAFVLMGDAAPFPIFRSDERGDEFLVRGEWVRDLGPRVAAWWDDEIGGGRTRREQAETGTSRQRDAEQEVLRHQPGRPAAAAAAVTQQPQAYPYPPPGYPPPGYPAPGQPPQGYRPGYGYQGPPQQPQPPAAPEAEAQQGQGSDGGLRSAPIPTRQVPAAGRELAPGVVQLPSGGPYAR